MASTKRIANQANQLIAQILYEKVSAIGIKYNDLASKSGIPRSSIYKLLSCDMIMSVDQLFSVCAALEIKSSSVVAEAERRLKTITKQPARRARLLQAPKPKILDTSRLAVAAKATPYSLEDEIEQTYND